MREDISDKQGFEIYMQPVDGDENSKMKFSPIDNNVMINTNEIDREKKIHCTVSVDCVLSEQEYDDLKKFANKEEK